MMDTTAAARVKEGGREVSNGMRLVRRASWLLLAAGACLLLSLAAAGRAAPPPQRSTRDKPNPPVRPRRTPTPRPTPKPRAPGNVTPTPKPDDPDVFENIRLKIAISGGAPARGVTLALWSRERDMPATEQPLKDKVLQEGAYVVNLEKGMRPEKNYWVTATSTDGRLSGEAAVSHPDDDNQDVSVTITLHRAVTFEVSGRRAGDGQRREVTLSVVEKGQEPSSSVPHGLGPDGKASFVKGLNPDAEYVLLTSDDEELPVNQDEIDNGVIRIDLPAPSLVPETFIKVFNEEGKPLRGAKVSVTLDDSRPSSKMTNEQGVVAFKADAWKVRAVVVEPRDGETYSCGGADEDDCPEPEGTRTIVINMGGASVFSWLGSIIKSATGIVFVIGAAAIIVVGVAIFRILLNPAPAPAPAPAPQDGGWRAAAAAAKRTSEAATSAGVNTSSQADGAGAQESSAAPARYETVITYGSDDAAQISQSPAAQAYPVPSSLSAEMAKEAYRHWMRKEKLTRNPVRLDIVLGNSANDQLRLLKETNDPGSKFILFTNGESGGWLFPNPARSVFQTEVEQTWRLVFNGLSKEEFGRKTGRLNPVEARRADGAEGRGMWVAEQKPYEFS